MNKLKPIYIQELKTYSKNEILEILDNDQKILDKLQKYLIVKNEDNLYQFTYVGVIIIDNLVINSYPKYIPKDAEVKRDFKQILKVIKKYKSLHEELDYENDELEDISYNQLSMMIFFLEDYYEYGIYSNIQNILEINGNGEIDWNRTVNYTDPIIKSNRPYYTQLHTKYKIDDVFDYFRLLHEYIITECSKRLERAGLIELFDLTPVELSDKTQDNFGELNLILEKLEKELHVEFNSRKQKLLKAMHTFLKEENSFSNENFLTLYGTSTYHVIWEEMCKKVFGDKLEKPVGELVDLNVRYNPKTRLIDIIEKPVWYYEGIHPNPAEGTFIPDIVTFWRNNFIILDAKYYKLKFNQKTLSGQPGLESITKQYLYELAFRQFIELHEFGGVKNAFLFPKYTGDVENLGHVELKILDDLEKIQVIMLPADKINQYYLDNKKMNIKSLKL